MSVFEAAEFRGHEVVSFFHDKNSGLHSIIAIHSTALGPACGGTRMYPYASGDEALNDVLRLSRGMSYKSAIANIPLGGGKAVIIGGPAKDKSEALLLAYADAVNALGGRYITAMDVGITPRDLPVIARRTAHVAGYDQPGKTGGDSGPLTALGVFVGLKTAVKHRLGADSTKGLTVAIQGLGKVGMGLAKQLHGEGARLIVSDVNAEAARQAAESLGAQVVSPNEIMGADCDVLSPNALGAIVNDRSIAALRAKVVAGGANNQLEHDEHGEALRQRGVLYAPDYVINGGGIIRVAGQIFGWTDAEIERRVLGIADTLAQIFRRGDSESAPTNVVADRIAEEKLAAGRHAPAKAAE
ncbi:MAG TPA: Glu/Leu/Phe/Val dehydrogenase dimerization domain-containing protein [Rhizomicrobium sp.]|nr:Glu/Leu/Phe/Val dehydrogenase dimerization domain-containing protein [Rhizomicrobium sp.]